MPLFWKPYRSDTTELLASLKAAKPSLEQEQRDGRALLWDRPVDREQQRQWRAAQVPQQAYVYQTKPR